MNYRREVDGLRAVAVIPVILFHAGFQVFAGGFVGVDVFFVISGYLITGVILTELEAGKFSIVSFYERRARRILPALFLIVGVCIPFGWLWLLPGDMRAFSQSIAAVSVFASNILFWRESGYFDTAAELKPLLHTWSLGVEEQFYVVFPLLVVTGWRFGKRYTLLLIAVLCVSSLTAAEWGAVHEPAAAFFLLPTRAWELAVGSFLAFHLTHSRHAKATRMPAQFLSAAGVALILFAVFTYTPATPFPGLFALAPVAGTVLIILFGWPQTVVGRVLGSKILVGVGLISYSAYLWHQPLLAFARHRSTEQVPVSILLLLCLLTFPLAYLSWRFVETPFRRKDVISRARLFKVAAIGSAGLFAFGLAGDMTGGFPSRIDYTPIASLMKIGDVYEYYKMRELLREGQCHSVPWQEFRDNHCIDIRQKNIVLWGDSYAASLYAGLEFVRSARHANYGITQLTDGNGPPFFTDGRTNDGKTLTEANEIRLRFVQEQKPDVIVIAWMGSGMNGLPTAESSLAALNETLDKIARVSPKSRIVVVGPFPTWDGPLQKQLINYYTKTAKVPPRFMSEGLVARDREWDVFFKSSLGGPKIEYLSAQDYFCNGNGCLTRMSDDLTDLSAIDSGHLTRNASVYLAERAEGVIFR